MHVLALLSLASGPVAAVMRRVFRSPGAARTLYPALAAGRLVVLRLLGRRRIGEGR